MARANTPEEKETIKNRISQLYLTGLTHYGMEKRLKSEGISVTRKTVGNYLAEILKEWHAQRVSDIDQWITAELMGLSKLEAEAWDAWELSKRDKTKSVTRKRGKPNAKKLAEILTTSIEQYDEIISGAGDPRFLDIIKDCKLQRLQYLTKGTFGKDGDVTNIMMQTVVEIGVVDRQRPPDDVQTIDAIVVEPD